MSEGEAVQTPDVAPGIWPIQARQWQLVGRPLRPSPEDVAIVEAIAREPRAAPLRVVLLGVTPELATLGWSEGTRLVAIDRCEGMIARVWPSSGAPRGAKAVLGDWRALPLEDASVDLVLGDGVTTLLAFPRDTAALFAEVSRVLCANGRFVARAFVPPTAPEALATIADDLGSGRVGTLEVLKLRLLMSLSAPPDCSVPIASAWNAWREMVPDPRALVATLGWSAAKLPTIDVYRDSPATYAFPSTEQLDAVARAAGLVDRVAHTPRYELGDRCPTFTWRKP